MPASKKILRNKEQAANRAAGIGDEQGRLPHNEKAAEVMAKCTLCSQEIRMTKRNVEAKAHFESRHPTSTFALCWPGQFDPSVVAAATTDGVREEKKLDKDFIRAEAAKARAIAEGAAPKMKKKTEDLSFLDAALVPPSNKKK